MNLILKLSGNKESVFPGGRNPYRSGLRRERIEQKVLSWFYRLTDPLFINLSDADESETVLNIYRKENLHTMEWSLQQSAASLLLKDLILISRRLTPSPLRNLFRRVRNFIILSLKMDEMEMQTEFSGMLVEGPERVILFKEKIENIQATGHKILVRFVRHLVHFSDAVKYMMLRSMGRIKRLPGLIASMHICRKLSTILQICIKAPSFSLGLIHKKMFCTIINKRN
jgi:hypothetical protein